MNKIKELRKENNLTLKELTLELNKKGLKINDGQLSKYERENQTPRNKDFWKSYILGYTEHRNSIDLTKIFEEMKKNGFKPTPINENSEDYLEYEKFLAEIEEENEANRKIFYKKYDTNEEEVLRFKSLLELFNELTESGQKEVIKFTKYLLQSQNESTDI